MLGLSARDGTSTREGSIMGLCTREGSSTSLACIPDNYVLYDERGVWGESLGVTREQPAAPVVPVGVEEEPVLDSYVQDYLQELQLFVCIIIFLLIAPALPCPPFLLFLCPLPLPTWGDSEKPGRPGGACQLG